MRSGFGSVAAGRAALALMLAALPGWAGAAPAAGVASEADLQAQIATMERGMKPGQGFAWQPVLRAGETVAALEIWKAPGKPAVHPDEAEYARVVAGAGEILSGGTLVDAATTKPGLVEGSRIEGGTRRALKPGDVFLVPAGAPHWFGVTGGRLVLLGTKIPVAAAH
ncbi:cupin domain-containing protein [Sphingomonas morindae]|uniref:Cupin domain-containing protein n=1 Tax=Sphingomonas morindae TaxID=1541170 RepID=A0ABY4X8G9_9SPHN|nr:cupin domain-containing protein [Sphingomonas morindae]USI73231.1 cupin domain-containing protein [Sphingomonas morindae]